MPTAPYRPEEDSDIVQVSPPVKEVKLEKDLFGSGSPETEDRDLYAPEHWPSARADVHVKSTEEIKRELEERVQQVVESTVKRVRQESDRIQTTAAPYVNRLQAFAESRPILATFLAIFLTLSALPLTCFAFFVGGSIVFILGIAAIGICVTTLGTLLFASSILLPVLLFTALVSFGILTALISLFLLHRLYLHISAACRTESTQLDGAVSGSSEAAEVTYERIVQGVMTWAEETVERVGIPAENIGLNTSRNSNKPSAPNAIGSEKQKDLGRGPNAGRAEKLLSASDAYGDGGKIVSKKSAEESPDQPARPTGKTDGRGTRP